MMTYIWSGLVVLSVIFGALTGRIDAVSTVALGECLKAVELSATLLGGLCLWGGVMKIAEKSGLSEKISGLLYPLLGRIFHGLRRGSAAFAAIAMNLMANLLGLGNAATPLGLAAMTQLQKENPDPETATDNMILFVVLNTASLQLIPTTTATLRLKAGSQAPMEILPCVWLASILSVTVGLTVAKLGCALHRRRR
ncbi:Spore maturation protein A [Anaerotruncus sp. 2789STDY5834896]|uniref:Spore maturation protein A n=1 Tax=uncultured Anaerotruncus sp. TaxID=905011 RepID=A0A1C6IGW9_9FIRM|nr:Spore maturation protein A [uncultured Anaerotruncus sp.]